MDATGSAATTRRTVSRTAIDGGVGPVAVRAPEIASLVSPIPTENAMLSLSSSPAAVSRRPLAVTRRHAPIVPPRSIHPKRDALAGRWCSMGRACPTPAGARSRGKPSSPSPPASARQPSGPRCSSAGWAARPRRSRRDWGTRHARGEGRRGTRPDLRGARPRVAGDQHSGGGTSTRTMEPARPDGGQQARLRPQGLRSLVSLWVDTAGTIVRTEVPRAHRET